jgi:anti-sigma factor RsiW
MNHPLSDLTAYLNGALDPERRAEVERHLEGCAPCRTERERLAWASSAIDALPAPPPPSPQFEARFYARLAAIEQPAPRGWLASIRWRYLAPLGAAAAFTAVFVVLWASHGRRQAEMAAQLELLENYELVASVGSVDGPEDVAVVAHLDELREGRP